MQQKAQISFTNGYIIRELIQKKFYFKHMQIGVVEHNTDHIYWVGRENFQVRGFLGAPAFGFLLDFGINEQPPLCIRKNHFLKTSFNNFLCVICH